MLLHCLLTAMETRSLSGLPCVPLASSRHVRRVEIFKSLRTEKLTGAPCRSERSAYFTPQSDVPDAAPIVGREGIILHIAGGVPGDRGKEEFGIGVPKVGAQVFEGIAQTQLAAISDVHVPVGIESSVDVQAVRHAIAGDPSRFQGW